MAWSPVNPFQRVVDRVLRVAEDFAGVPITYARGDLEQSVVALLGQTLSEATDRDEATVEGELFDVLLPATAPDFGAGWTEPDEGDVLLVPTPSGATWRLRVAAANAGERVWRYADGLQTRIRVSTRFDGVQP